MVFGALIQTLREHQFRGIRRRTQQLDPQTRSNLQEFLEEVPAEQEELALLQKELNLAHEKQSQLQDKEAFVGKRLASYRSQLQRYEAAQEKQEQEQEDNEKDSKHVWKQDPTYLKHLESLKQIEASHQTMIRGLEVLQDKIDILEERQMHLSHLTEECQVVYETTQAMQALEVSTTTEEATDDALPVVGDEESPAPRATEEEETIPEPPTSDLELTETKADSGSVDEDTPPLDETQLPETSTVHDNDADADDKSSTSGLPSTIQSTDEEASPRDESNKGTSATNTEATQ